MADNLDHVLNPVLDFSAYSFVSFVLLIRELIRGNFESFVSNPPVSHWLEDRTLN